MNKLLCAFAFLTLSACAVEADDVTSVASAVEAEPPVEDMRPSFWVRCTDGCYSAGTACNQQCHIDNPVGRHTACTDGCMSSEQNCYSTCTLLFNP